MSMYKDGWRDEGTEYDQGFKDGSRRGWNEALLAAQNAIVASEGIEHAVKLELHQVLEKAKLKK